MIEQFANIFRVPDLRKRVIFTLGVIALCRVGVYVPIPGVDTQVLESYLRQYATTGIGQILGLINLFAGGAMFAGAVFSLGIMPYISSSIIFQLLVSVIPALEKLQKEGESGRKKINQYTRMATVALCLFQAFIMTRGLYQIEFGGQFVVPAEIQGIRFQIFAAILMTTGTMILMWLGEQIDEFGIGNGISIIIMVGILERLPYELGTVLQHATLSLTPAEHEIGIVKLAVLLAMALVIIVGVIFVTQGQRRIPVQQAKHTRGRRVYGGMRHFLPLRVNQAGVIPIIFAQSLLIFPSAVFQGIRARLDANTLLYRLVTIIGDSLSSESFFYMACYVALIFFFSYFWTAIQFNPTEMADNMKDYGSFIPGIRPGRHTAEHLENVMTHITLPGAAFLAVIAVLPTLVSNAMGIHYGLASFYGGTGLLIVVGVGLDVIQKIESHLLMRHYEGFLRGGRIRGRR
ncbi:MAG: preprotein translocase subunit SecY [Planctomycetes bacterium]|nr:preprotein translocase subunit SecY [Planctomycetota bacterium]MBM4078172.1 preprotein translocase subunit SecY [Planctomycetota bacterium]MBM4083187.1 preprotein translocase subunit SecY [Planctomycetota bacterium]